MTAPAGGVYLRSYLAPLMPFLERADVTDLLVQREGEVWVEAGGVMTRNAAPDVTAALVEQLSHQIAAASHQAVSRAHPLLAGTLPTGERVQVVLPPATRGAPVLAIRRQVMRDLTLADLARSGAFGPTRRASDKAGMAGDVELTRRLEARDVEGFLREAVTMRRNIVVSGGTGSGKTTLLNALLREVGSTERVIAIEDTPEVVLHHANSLGLVAAKGSQGEAQVTIDDLLQASLRLRPDRLIVGEIRGPEAYTFLRAVNTGHPGSITTVHADSCSGALQQIALMVLQAGTPLRYSEILTYVEAVVDVVVQCARDARGRHVAELSYARRPG